MINNKHVLLQVHQSDTLSTYLISMDWLDDGDLIKLRKKCGTTRRKLKIKKSWQAFEISHNGTSINPENCQIFEIITIFVQPESEGADRWTEK